MLLIEFEQKSYDLEKLKLYNEFLIECSQKDYTGVPTHKHHILPKKMGGTNRKINLIKLSYQDHYDAHLILSNCFEIGSFPFLVNKYALNFIKDWIDDPEKAFNIMLNNKLRQYANNRKGKEPWNKGKSHSTETKEKISIKRKGRFVGEKNPFFGKRHTAETREILSKTHKGKKLTKDSIDKRTLTRQNNGRSWFTQDSIDLMVKNNSVAKTVKHIETGMVFLSISRAGRFFGLKQWKMNKAIERGEFIFVEDQS